MSIFHLAYNVTDLDQARAFYGDLLGCTEGRSTETWVDYNFFGHQLVIHYKPKSAEDLHTNSVDGKDVPVPHFGIVLPWNDFHRFSDHLIEKGIQFVIAPYIRFEGQIGEQATMFFKDPSGNALEFKSFKDINQLFAK